MVSVFVSNINNCILLSYFFVLHYNFILDIVDFILGDLSVCVCKPHPADRVCAVQLFGFYKFCRRSSLVSTSLSKTLQTPFLQNYTTETHTDKHMFPSHQRAFSPTAISRRTTVSCPSKGSEPSQCEQVYSQIWDCKMVDWHFCISLVKKHKHTPGGSDINVLNGKTEKQIRLCRKHLKEPVKFRKNETKMNSYQKDGNRKAWRWQCYLMGMYSYQWNQLTVLEVVGWIVKCTGLSVRSAWIQLKLQTDCTELHITNGQWTKVNCKSNKSF